MCRNCTSEDEKPLCVRTRRRRRRVEEFAEGDDAGSGEGSLVDEVEFERHRVDGIWI